MNLDNKKFLVAGMGISGIGAAKLLKEISADFVLYDSKSDLDKNKILEEIGLEKDHPFICGDIKKTDFDNIDVLVISPGVPIDSDIVLLAREAGCEIIGEIELAYSVQKGKLIAITGTNGKTTTTALTGEIMKNFNAHTQVVGNIGTSYAAAANHTFDDGVVVAEISSFQLESIVDFKPEISAVLNITPDHLNRHKTMENYSKIKMDIGKNQTADDFMILNYDDEYLRNAAKNVKAKVLFFSSRCEVEEGAFFKEGNIYINLNGKKELFCSENEVNILGTHNMENIMAAVLMSICAKVPMDIIKESVKNFKAVEHRIEFTKEVKGVKYYNDSKGTNIDATIKAIQAMRGKSVLIAGGYDKGADFRELVREFNDDIKLVVYFGATADKIEAACKELAFDRIKRVADLTEAVKESANAAISGENVLFSPACASWDMYKNFEQRGEHFKKLVGML